MLLTILQAFSVNSYVLGNLTCSARFASLLLQTFDLDSFALLLGQINLLNILLKKEKTPLFHKQVCLHMARVAIHSNIVAVRRVKYDRNKPVSSTECRCPESASSGKSAYCWFSPERDVQLEVRFLLKSRFYQNLGLHRY